MRVRVKALVAMKDAMLPGFCAQQDCGESCIFWNPQPEHPTALCYWMEVYQNINLMESQIWKFDNHGSIEEPEPDNNMVNDPNYLEID